MLLGTLTSNHCSFSAPHNTLTNNVVNCTAPGAGLRGYAGCNAITRGYTTNNFTN